MVQADIVALVCIAVFGILGFVLGFGRGVKIFTGGIFGVIISIVICYFIFGIVIGWGFVQDLLVKINNSIRGGGDNGFLNWLADSAKVSYIIFAVILFVVVQILRKILVKVFCNVMSSKKPVIRSVNRVLGVILFWFVMIVLAFLAAHVVCWVGGSTAESLTSALSGSFLKLDWLYAHNPLTSIINQL